MLAFNCPACRHYGEADDALAGEIIGCATCMAHFRLHDGGELVVESAGEARPSIQEPGKGAVVQAWARCPRCGARKTNQNRCEFCGNPFWSGETLQSNRSQKRRLKVAGDLSKILLVCLILLGLPAAGWYFKAAADDEQRLCKEMLMIVYNAILQSDARPEGVPSSIGRRFLVDLAVRERVSLLCPSVDHRLTRRGIDYRGPARPWIDLLPDDPVMADLQENHRGLSVLLKNGVVLHASKGSFLYLRALQETRE